MESAFFYDAEHLAIDAQCDQTISGGRRNPLISLCDGKLGMQCALA